MEIITRNILLSLALVATSTMVPILGIIAGLFTPYPLLRTLVASNFRNVIIVAIPSLIFLLVLNPLTGGLYIIETVIPALIAGYLLLSRSNPLEIVVKATLSSGIILIVGYIGYMIFTGTHPVKYFFDEMAKVVNDSGAVLMMGGGDVTTLFTLLSQISFGFVMSGIAFSLICSIGLMLKRQKSSNEDDTFVVDRFAGTMVPFNFVYLFLATLIGSMGQNSGVVIMASSILFFLVMLYAFQGVMILSTFFKTRKVPKPFQFVVYIFVIIQPGLIFILAFVGLLESWFEYRRKWLKLL